MLTQQGTLICYWLMMSTNIAMTELINLKREGERKFSFFIKIEREKTLRERERKVFCLN